MSETTDKSWHVSRRGFLKFTAFTAAGVTLGKYLRDYAVKHEVFKERWGQGPAVESWGLSICRQCPAGCGLRVRLVDGDAKKLDGNPLCPIARGTLCPKGQAGLQALYDPDRLLGPVKRVGQRGENRWERISWDDALADVHRKLNALRAGGDPQRLAWIAERNDATQGQLIRRFMRAYGSPNLFEFVDLRDEAARVAMHFCQGVDELPAYDLENTNFILSFGTPVLESWLSPTWMGRQYGQLHRGRREQRGRLVQVEARLSPTAAKADQWIPVSPGTEAAVALAVAHVLIREGLYDRAFVEEHTVGFADWKDADGHEHEGLRTMVLRHYPPGEVTAATGVPVTTILQLARDFAARKPAVAIGEQVPLSGGVALAWAVHVLNALNGMVDREGGVLTQRALPLKPLPELTLDATARHGLGAAALPKAIPDLGDAIAGARPYGIEMLFVSSSRFFAVTPAVDRFYRATEHVPFIVSFSSTLDDSATFADLILPDHSPLEKWQDVAPLPVNGTPSWAVSRPALEPVLDTRHSGEVVMELGRQLGGSVAAAFPWKDTPALLRFVAEGLFDSRRGTPFVTPYETSWINQLEAGGWWIPSARTVDEFWDQLVKAGGWIDPIYQYERWGRAFQTPSGKLDFSRLLRYAPPQWTGDEHDFPLKLKPFTVLTTGGLDNPNQPFLQEALAPLVQGRWTSWVVLNPETAHRFGIADGERVWLESPAGRLAVRARLFAGAVPDVASVLLGQEHRAGGAFAQQAPRGVADLIAYAPDPLGRSTMPLAATTRVKVSKTMGGA